MTSPYGPDHKSTGGHQPAPFSDEAVGDDTTAQLPGMPNPYGQTAYQQHGYPPQEPTYAVTGATSPFGQTPYGPQQYGPAGAPPAPYGQPPIPPKKSSTGMIFGIVGGIAVAVIVVIVIAVAVIGKGDSNPTTGVAASQSPSVASTPTNQSTTPSGDSGSVTGQEAQFKAGTFAETPPVGETQRSTFLSAYPTPNDWLRNRANDDQITAVFTSDTRYNSGMQSKPSDTESYAAASYKPQYYKTIFIYWTPSAEPDLKEFMLAFGYAGAQQWWQHFDVMQSASKQLGSSRTAELSKVLNNDAVCRVLSWGGYSQTVANKLGGCPTSSWTDNWLQQQIAALGVTITDY